MMSKLWIGSRIARDRRISAGLLLLVVGAGAVLLAIRWRPERFEPLRITAGDEMGRRHDLAIALVRRAEATGLPLAPIDSAGSLSAVEALRLGQCEVAMVQGGLYPSPLEGIRQVAALHVEPLHLLVREDLAGAVAADLSALAGRTVNLGEHGSGTRTLALEVLRHAGLLPEDWPHEGAGNGAMTRPGCDGEPDARRTYVATAWDYGQLEREGEHPDPMPDAVFTVSTVGSPVTQHLVSEHRYRLVPVPFAEAFRWIGLGPIDARPEGRLVRSSVVASVVPRRSYGDGHVEPGEDIPTLGCRLLLLARADVPAGAVERLIEAVAAAEFSRLDPVPLEARLRDPTLSELQPHPGVDLFLSRNRPLIAEELKEDAEKAVTIGGAALGGLLFLVPWLRRRSRKQRDERLERYLIQVADIERRGRAIELSEAPDLTVLIALQAELGDLKDRALRKFAADELEGAELLSAFLTHANAARDYLTRLILHRRRSVERASRQPRETAATGSGVDPGTVGRA